MIRLRGLTACLLAFALTGCCCAQPQRPVCGQPVPPDLHAQARLYPSAARVSAWQFLARKHDHDGDGRITRAEYGRGDEAFRRLDSDEDGAVTADDLKHGPVHKLVAMMTVLRYFQQDAIPMRLHRDELEASFRSHDANGDGRLSAAEFRTAAQAVDEAGASPVPKMVGGMNPHRSLVLEAGTDGDDQLSLAELRAWFDKRADESGVFKVPPPKSRPTPRRDGPEPGAPAPDFTLQPPGGGEPFTLSSLQGKKPVALIFGSYT